MILTKRPDGTLSLQLTASLEGARQFREGKRTLVHIPKGWPLLVKGPRPLQKGDYITLWEGALDQQGVVQAFQDILDQLRSGDVDWATQTCEYALKAAQGEIVMAPICRVDTLHLHDMAVGDLPKLGRNSTSLISYIDSWNTAWSGDGWSWDQNPEVYAIAWDAVPPRILTK